MAQVTYAPGSVIRNRERLWRVDAQLGDVLVATSIHGGETAQHRFYMTFDGIRPGRLEPRSAEIVGHPAAQDPLLRAYPSGLLHGTAPLLSLERSRVIPKDFQLVPVVMALEIPRVRMLIADDVELGRTIQAGLIVYELFPDLGGLQDLRSLDAPQTSGASSRPQNSQEMGKEVNK